MGLVELRAGGLAVLDAVALTPGPGLTALTGETGSGKSLCITALRLVLGARVESDVVREGREAAIAAAVFDETPAPVRERLMALGVPQDDALLTLTREIRRGGRGACRINGALVSLPVLREVGEELVEVTAQGESHRLLRPAHQRAVLDAAGGPELESARAAVAAAVRAWREAEAALAVARGDAAAGVEELDRAREIVEDLGGLRLRAGEIDELAAERRRLTHALALSSAVDAVREAAAGADEGGAADVLAAALASARGAEHLDAEVDAVLAAAAEEVARLRELAARAREVGAGLEVDAGRLGEVEERLDVLDRVCRRFGSIDAAGQALTAARRTLDGAGAADREVVAAEQECSRLRAEAGARAGELSRLRRRAAVRLEGEVSGQLRRLRLPQARFRAVVGAVPDAGGVEVDGERLACGPEGVDSVEFRLATVRDGVPIPLGAGVSGGELSRVALALRAARPAADDCPTLVLDEVDTGVGGETAARVGEVLAAVAGQRQVLVVTHRAEIAARAADHLLVERRDGARGASSVVRPVTGDDRALEIARLLSGRTTAAAVARAVELLDEGGAPRRPRGARTMAP